MMRPSESKVRPPLGNAQSRDPEKLYRLENWLPCSEIRKMVPQLKSSPRRRKSLIPRVNLRNPPPTGQPGDSRFFGRIRQNHCGFLKTVARPRHSKHGFSSHTEISAAVIPASRHHPSLSPYTLKPCFLKTIPRVRNPINRCQIRAVEISNSNPGRAWSRDLIAERVEQRELRSAPTDRNLVDGAKRGGAIEEVCPAESVTTPTGPFHFPRKIGTAGSKCTRWYLSRVRISYLRSRWDQPPPISRPVEVACFIRPEPARWNCAVAFRNAGERMEHDGDP